MSTVLFVPLMFNLAETTRMIEVARALGPQHAAVFAGYEDEYVDLVRAAGFTYLPLEPAWTRAEQDQAMAYDQGRSLRHPFTTGLVRERVRCERVLIRELGARAVVTGTNLTSFVAARAEGVPLIYPVPFALTVPQVAQTRRMGLVRGTTAAARTADLLATAALRLVYTRVPLGPRSFAQVAHENGVAWSGTVADLIRADHNLLTEMDWELDGFDLPDDFARVGPIFAHLDAPLPPIVAELAAAPEPLVYLGLGSSAGRDLVLDAAHALADLPVNVVAPVGHYLDADDVLPANVHLTELLPAHRLGGLVDAAVLHGGQGTVQTSCATGVPFVGMGLQPEQTWHVRRCEERGNAVAVPPRRVRRQEFRTALHRVLHDPAVRTAASEVAEAYEREDGARASARVIESLLT